MSGNIDFLIEVGKPVQNMERYQLNNINKPHCLSQDNLGCFKMKYSGYLGYLAVTQVLGSLGTWDCFPARSSPSMQQYYTASIQICVFAA
jgi:hypothetical protein